jgi:hypothetical protein
MQPTTAPSAAPIIAAEIRTYSCHRPTAARPLADLPRNDHRSRRNIQRALRGEPTTRV